MIPLIPVTIAAVVSTATVFYVNKKKREAVDELDSSGEEQAEGSEVISIISRLKQKATARSNELEAIKAQLEEHSKVLGELEGSVLSGDDEDESISEKIKHKAAVRHGDLAQIKAQLKKLEIVLQQHEKKLQGSERSLP